MNADAQKLSTSELSNGVFYLHSSAYQIVISPMTHDAMLYYHQPFRDMPSCDAK